MPVNQGADFYLNERPYMLLRNPTRGRAWVRTGAVDKSGIRFNQDEQKFGGLPDELRFAEVWDDWSGGGGYPVRSPAAPNHYHWGHGVDSRFPGLLTHAQQMQPIDIDEAQTAPGLRMSIQNINHWLDIPALTTTPLPGQGAVLALGRNVKAKIHPMFVVPAAGSNNYIPSPVTASGQTFRKPAIFGSFIAIGLASHASGQWWLEPLDGAAGTFGRNNTPVRGFVNAGNRLWRWFGPQDHERFVQVAAAGASLTPTGNWAPSGGYEIGNGQNPINDMLAFEDNLYAGMPDGLFQGDVSGTFWNVTPGLSGEQHPDNLRSLTAHQGAITFNHLTDIYSYEASTTTARLRTIGPPPVGAKSPIHGRFRELHGYGQWLFAGLDTGSLNYIFAGRDASFPLPYTWHHIGRLPALAQVQRLRVDGVTTNSGGSPLAVRLWVATSASGPGAATGPIYRMNIPVGFGNALADNVGWTPDYTASMHVDLGLVDRGAPGVMKLFEAVEVWADDLVPELRWGEITYRVDGEETAHLLGVAASSPVTYLNFPPDTLGRGIEVALDSYAKAEDPYLGIPEDEIFGVRTAPAYRAIVLRGVSRPPTRQIIEAQVHVADSLKDRQGGWMRPASSMLKELRDLADPKITPGAVPLVDLTGVRQCVVVLPPLQESEMFQESKKEAEIQVSVRMMVVECSGNSTDVVVEPTPPPEPGSPPAVSSEFYIHTSKGLFKRSTGGVWARTAAPSGGSNTELVSRLVTAPSDANTVYAVWSVASVFGLYKSTDGGATWTAKTVPTGVNPTGINMMSVDETDPNEVYLAYPLGTGLSPRADGIWKSTNGGTTWALFAQSAYYGNGSLTNGVFVSDTGADKRVWYSARLADTGAPLMTTLTRFNWSGGPGGTGDVPGPQFYTHGWSRTIVGVRGDSRYAFGIGVGAYQDGIVRIDPATPPAGYIDYDSGTKMAGRLDVATTAASCWWISMRSDGTGLAWFGNQTASGGHDAYTRWVVLKSTDYGISWAEVYSWELLPTVRYEWSDWAHNIAFDPDNTGHWWMVVQDTSSSPDQIWALYSTDEGVTWNRELVVSEVGMQAHGISVAG